MIPVTMDWKRIYRIAIGIGLIVALFGVGFVWIKQHQKVPDALQVLGESISPTHTFLYPMTVDGIFSSNHEWVKKLPVEKTVSIIATGDVIPARSVNYKMVTGHGFRWPFEKTADTLQLADLTVINLETPLMSACAPSVEGMIFCGDARVVEGLKYAGVDIATLGNNHIGNHFEEGIIETKRILSDAGITFVSVGAVYKEIKGITFAFLAYNDIGAPESGVPWADVATITQEVSEAKKHADVVMVSYHWGEEYVAMPGDHVRELAHLSIDAGADVILGNHPHWIQPIELYNGKYITYAHGNFVFDQEWSPETKLGVVGRYIFYDKKLVDVEYLPLKIEDYGQPHFLSGQESKNILDMMKERSQTMVK